MNVFLQNPVVVQIKDFLKKVKSANKSRDYYYSFSKGFTTLDLSQYVQFIFHEIKDIDNRNGQINKTYLCFMYSAGKGLTKKNTISCIKNIFVSCTQNSLLMSFLLYCLRCHLVEQTKIKNSSEWTKNSEI